MLSPDMVSVSGYPSIFRGFWSFLAGAHDADVTSFRNPTSFWAELSSKVFKKIRPAPNNRNDNQNLINSTNKNQNKN